MNMTTSESVSVSQEMKMGDTSFVEARGDGGVSVFLLRTPQDRDTEMMNNWLREQGYGQVVPVSSVKGVSDRYYIVGPVTTELMGGTVPTNLAPDQKVYDWIETAARGTDALALTADLGSAKNTVDPHAPLKRLTQVASIIIGGGLTIKSQSADPEIQLVRDARGQRDSLQFAATLRVPQAHQSIPQPGVVTAN